MSDPSEIIQTGLFDANGSIFAVHVVGSIAYVADIELGLLIVDMSTPQSPVLIASFYDGGEAINLDVVGDFVYVADWTGVLEIIQVSTV